MKITKLASFFTLIILLFVASPCTAAEKTQEKGGKESKEISDWDARLEYARLLSNLRRYDESLVQLKKLLSENPTSVPVQIEMAQVLYYQGNHQQALQLLEKIPSTDVSDKAKLLMAEIYLALKEYPKAESAYRDQLKRFPGDDLAKFKLAELLSWQKNYGESVQLYRQLLAHRPDDIQLRRKYAMVLMWMGEEEKAAEELEKTLHTEVEE